MYKETFAKLFIIVFFLICAKTKVDAQDLLRNYDLSTIKVDKLTDADILKFKQQLATTGLSEEQAEQIALSKGMSVSEIQKLRVRLQQVSSASQNMQKLRTPNSGYNNSYNNSYDGSDTLTNPYSNIDTTTKKPLINKRIFG